MVSRAVETYDPNGLRAGDYPVQLVPITLASSAALSAGAVLGTVTASGKYLLSAAAAADGSETPSAILAQDADASAGDVAALAYVSGAFDAAKASFGAGHTAESVETAFRAAQAPLFLVARAA